MKTKQYEKLRPSTRPQQGVTLLELLVVVVIISIITAFAYPSYMQFVARAKRSAGKSALLQVADRQQQFFMDNKQYATSLTNLGYAENPIVIGDDGTVLTAGSSDSVYSVALSGVTATTYTVTGTPLSTQATKDTRCGELTLTHTGEKGQSGSGDNCW